jgi:ADP-ribose pyrophosphatase YjhB (NUDIX family)
VHDVFGYWTLPKGHIQNDEKEEEGVVRELHKEIGLDVRVIEKLGENEYIANKPESGKVVKHVSYYMTVSPFTSLVLEKKGGLDDAKWFEAKEIPTLRIYDDIRPLLNKAIEKANTTDFF